MLIITCPWCGARDESEFICGGPEKPPRPENASDLSDGDWIDYLIVSPNPTGWLAEKWWHANGCGRWFTLERHTVTHEVRPFSGDDVSGEAVSGEGKHASHP